MSYRPPSKAPKGAWARHLHEQRRARDLSQTQAFELVYERVGWSPKSRTAYVAIDMGDRRPKPEEATVLGVEFGWPPDPVDAPESGASDVPALVSLVGQLVEELQAERAARSAWERGLLETLQAIAQSLGPRDGPELGPPVDAAR